MDKPKRVEESEYPYCYADTMNGVLRRFGMTEFDYHSHPFINRSKVAVALSRCPAAAVAGEDLLSGAPSTSNALLVGSAVHKAVLEPDDFDKAFVCAPEVDRRTKKGKLEWQAFEELHPAHTVLKPSDYEMVMGVSESVRKHPVAGPLVAKGASEVSWFYNCHGVDCRVRTDKLRPDLKTVIDLKTTGDASERGFNHSVSKFGYDLQEAWYCEPVKQFYGQDDWRFVFIAVEKTPPYLVGVYELDPVWKERGMKRMEEGLKLFKECLETDTWPDYTPKEIGVLHAPHWVSQELQPELVV